MVKVATEFIARVSENSTGSYNEAKCHGGDFWVGNAILS